MDRTPVSRRTAAERRTRSEPPRARRWTTPLAAAAALLLAGAACQPEQELELPTASELEGTYGSRTDVSLNGNVVVVEATQDPAQLRQGGDLWAKVGPYIYAFSPQTQEIFNRWNGVAAVRVRTVTPGGTEVARAQLRRDELTSVTWREAKSRVVRARKEGTQKPGYLEDLVDYGETHTEYRYSGEYVDQP